MSGPQDWKKHPFVVTDSGTPAVTKSKLHKIISTQRSDVRAETRGLAIFFTGLSGAGKTIIARQLCARLEKFKFRVTLLDGDDLHVRCGSDLTEEEAVDQIMRVLTDCGTSSQPWQASVCGLCDRRPTCEYWNVDPVAPCKKQERHTKLLYAVLTIMAGRRSSLNDIARELGVERHTIERAVRSVTGRGFRDLQQTILLEIATSRLREGRSIKEVAFDLGFGSPQAFHRFVRRSSGRTPASLNRLA